MPEPAAKEAAAMRLPARRRAAALWAPAVLFLAIAGFYWKITLTKQYSWMESPDLANQVLPWFQYQAGELHRGRIPLWDPYEWGGQSLIGQAQPGVAYPLNWLLFAAPLRHGWIRQMAMNWYFVLIHFMAALFCYFLCRDLGRSRPASLLAGLAFALGGWIGTTDWPQMLNGAVWAPLVFLFLLRTLRGERPAANAALSGAFLGMAFLSGHHQVPIFISLGAGTLWIAYFARRGTGWWRWPALRPALAFGLFLFLVGALQTLPAYEYGKLAVRWVGADHPVGWKEAVPYFVHNQYGLYPLSVLGIVLPGVYRNADPFIGFTVIAFAFLAVTALWRDRQVRMFAALAAAALVYSFAGYAVLEGLLYALLPMVDKARSPSMAILMFHFAVVVLSAYGLDSYLESTGAWPKRVTWILAGFAGLLWAVLVVLSLTPAPRAVDADRVAVSALAALFLAGLLYGWRRGHVSIRAAQTIATLLVLFELGTVSGFSWGHRDLPNSYLKKMAEHTDIVEFIRSQQNPVRLEIDDQVIPYNFGDWQGIDVFGGYLASLTTDINRIQGDYEARMLFGVNFWVGGKPLRANQVQVFTGRNGLNVYANPEAFPRTWTVHQAVGIRTPDEIGPHLHRPLEELRRQAFVYGAPPGLESCAAPDRVRMVRRDAGRVVIEADMQCRGMVIAGEAWYPGWQAQVDGRPVPLYEAYSALRGVVVDRGTHRIEMRYRPGSVILGAVLTALGILGACVIGFKGRRQRLS